MSFTQPQRYYNSTALHFSRRNRAPINVPCIAPKDIFHDYNFVMGEADHNNYGYPGHPGHYVQYGYDAVMDSYAARDGFAARDGYDARYGYGAARTADRDSSTTPSSYSGSCTQDDEDYGDDDEDEDGTMYDSHNPAHLPSSRVSPENIPQDDRPGGSGIPCGYIDPNDGSRCYKMNRSTGERARHWKSCHLYAEAKAMLRGRMTVGSGTAITSLADLEDVRSQIQCPHCGALITRSDALDRHIESHSMGKK